MQENFFNIGILIFIFMMIASAFTNCKKREYPDQYNVNIQQTITQDAASGLDLKAVGELLKEVKTAEDFERRLNDASEGLNNLDLDENDQVDYIRVTEYGNGTLKGFSLTVDLDENETQEIATIEVEKIGDRAHVQTHGNSNIYGNNHYYRSSFGIGDFLLMSFLFDSMRSPYYSPYRYGNYPDSYRSYRPTTRDRYERRISDRTRSSSFSPAQRSTLSQKLNSPNSTKTSSKIKAPLRNPTASQKSFQARNPSKAIKSGGFGKPKSALSSSKTSNFSNKTSSSWSRSGSSFGGK